MGGRVEEVVLTEWERGEHCLLVSGVFAEGGMDKFTV